MAGINRIGSRMDICDEGFDEAPAIIEKRKRDLQSKQTSKSPFVIGTIDDINQKISKLENRLQSYAQLVVESRASDYPDSVDCVHSSSLRCSRYQEKESDKREVSKFAGIYSMKSTLLPNLSSRVKNISKISFNPAKDKTHLKKEKDSNKPKFVELHQYPGYESVKLTPLPGFEATEILQIVVDASVRLDRKPHYQPEFKRLFFSPMSQAVLQDIFWYVFLDKFQSNAVAQHKLFNRTAHNYVKLIFYTNDSLFRDTFLKDYTRLVAQAVYASFCHCFPDSYRQFGESFKNDLVYLVFGWISGIRPTPRYWSDWNLSKLEPANIKLREEIMSKSKKKQAQIMSFNIDYLDSLVSSHPSKCPSTQSLEASKSSMGSSWDKHKRKKVHKLFKSSLSPETRLSQDSNTLDTQTGVKKSTGDSGSQRSSQPGETTHSQKSKADCDALSPIRELASAEGTTSVDDKKMSFMHSAIRDSNPKKESHPACKGPDFLKAAFNLHGRSPLVAHFLRMRNITSDLNIVTRIQHTQLYNLPPIDAPTYADVIRESSKTVRTIEKMFQELYSRNQKEMTVFLNQQAAEMNEHRKRENALLAKKPEVKRLSELIILEQKKGIESISAGAREAVEAALMSND